MQDTTSILTRLPRSFQTRISLSTHSHNLSSWRASVGTRVCGCASTRGGHRAETRRTPRTCKKSTPSRRAHTTFWRDALRRVQRPCFGRSRDTESAALVYARLFLNLWNYCSFISMSPSILKCDASIFRVVWGPSGCTSSPILFVVCPHSNYLNGSNVIQYLINETMLNVDSS